MISSLKPFCLNNNNKIAGLLAGFVIVTASLYAPMLNAAPIYKVIDEQTGQVTFTDRPQSYEQQADKQVSQTAIVTHAISDNNASNNNSAGADFNKPSVAPSQTTPAKSLPVNYQLTMTEPSAARAYRRPAQSINVNLQLKPALQADDRVIIYLNNNEVAQGLSTSIATVDILPGTHKIKAVVKNEAGQTLRQIERTVYVIQNTLILQNKKKIAEQMLAYQRLPWHQKMLLRMGKKDNNRQKIVTASK